MERYTRDSKLTLLLKFWTINWLASNNIIHRRYQGLLSRQRRLQLKVSSSSKGLWTKTRMSPKNKYILPPADGEMYSHQVQRANSSRQENIGEKRMPIYCHDWNLGNRLTSYLYQLLGRALWQLKVAEQINSTNQAIQWCSSQAVHTGEFGKRKTLRLSLSLCPM